LVSVELELVFNWSPSHCTKEIAKHMLMCEQTKKLGRTKNMIRGLCTTPLPFEWWCCVFCKQTKSLKTKLKLKRDGLQKKSQTTFNSRKSLPSGLMSEYFSVVCSWQ
jgi:hypothetical protein